MIRSPAVVPVALFLFACSGTPSRVMTPNGMQLISWSPEETTKDIAVRHLRRTESASHHVVRLNGSEVPHTHEHSDLTVTVLSGKVRMHLGSHTTVVTPGQVIDVPRGTPHFAENLSKSASEAYTVFSPPLEKTDNHPLGHE